MKDKNVVFMGTPDFATPVLEMLIKNTNVVMVVCQPDKEVGRKREIVYSPVKTLALNNNIPVFQPKKIRTDFKELEKLDIDLIVTCAYGQIIPKEVLDLPKCGCVNVHASILPKYRGSAPMEWAIINGDKETGVTIMYMDEGMDTGDIIKIAKVPISDTDTLGTIHDVLSILGRDTLESVLPDLFSGNAKRIKQPDDFTLAPRIKREDERIDFNNKGAYIVNKVRALNPKPLSNIVIDNNEIKVLKVRFKEGNVSKTGVIEVINKMELGISCQDGIIYLETIKPSGKKEMNITSYLNGVDKEKLAGELVNEQRDI